MLLLLKLDPPDDMILDINWKYKYLTRILLQIIIVIGSAIEDIRPCEQTNNLMICDLN